MSKNTIEFLGFAAGALTTGAAVPQIAHALRIRSMRDVSGWMLACMTTGILLWLIYGISLGSGPLIIWNAVTLALYAVLTTMKLTLGNFSSARAAAKAGGFGAPANSIEDAQR